MSDGIGIERPTEPAPSKLVLAPLPIPPKRPVKPKPSSNMIHSLMHLKLRVGIGQSPDEVENIKPSAGELRLDPVAMASLCNLAARTLLDAGEEESAVLKECIGFFIQEKYLNHGTLH